VTGVQTCALPISMIAFGGAVAVMPEMHRYIVDERHWISAGEFSTAFTIGQVAPGPNVLFVTLVGWQAAGWPGALAATAGIMLPSMLLTLAAYHGIERWRDTRLVRSFREGMAPVTIGLMLASGWVIASSTDRDWRGGLLTAATVLLVLSTRLNPLWLIGLGGALGLTGVL
jgi:chromate transporter